MADDLKQEEQSRIKVAEPAQPTQPAASSAELTGELPFTIQAGTVIDGRFEIIKHIADGAYAQVFEARHRLLDKNIALKVLKCSSDMDSSTLERFKREAQIVSGLNHPGIVRLLDYGLTEDKRPFIVMELIDGRALDELIASGERVAPNDCIALFSQLCDTLAHAHQAGIVHRDLKPANIIIVGSGAQRSLKVVDFGLARTIEADPEKNRLTQTGNVVGTPFYMSPEQCLGHLPDERSDVYSLACVMYESLCGKLPFPGPAIFDVMRQHVEEPPMPLSKQRPDLKSASALERVILKGLAKDRDHRFQSMHEMQEALLKAQTKTWKFLDFWHDTSLHAKAGRRRSNILGRVLWGIGGAAVVAVMLPMLFDSVNQNADAKWNRYNHQGQEALNAGRYHDSAVYYGLAAKLASSFAHDRDKAQWEERYRGALEREALATHLEGAAGNEAAIDGELVKANEEWKKASGEKDALLLQLWHVYPNDPSKAQRAQFTPLAMQVLDVAHRYCDDKRFDDALALTNETIDKADHVLNPKAAEATLTAPGEYRQVRGRALFEQGRVLNNLHRHKTSEPLLREAVELLCNQCGPNSLEVAKAEYQLALSLINQKQDDEGQRWLDSAKKGFNEAGFDEGTAFALEAQGAIYGNEQKYESALEQYKNAMAVQQKNHDYQAAGECLEQICWFYTAMRKVPEGEAYMQKMLEETVSNGRNSDLDRAYLNVMLGRFQEHLGKTQSAMKHYADALSIYQNYFVPSSKLVTSTMAEYARAAQRSGDDATAQRMYAELRAINQRLSKNLHSVSLWTTRHVGTCIETPTQQRSIWVTT